MPANTALFLMIPIEPCAHLNCNAALTGAANSAAKFTKQPIAKHVTQRGAPWLVFRLYTEDSVLKTIGALAFFLRSLQNESACPEKTPYHTWINWIYWYTST